MTHKCIRIQVIQEVKYRTKYCAFQVASNTRVPGLHNTRLYNSCNMKRLVPPRQPSTTYSQPYRDTHNVESRETRGVRIVGVSADINRIGRK